MKEDMKLYKNKKLIINRISNYYKSTLDSIRDVFITFIAFYFLVVNELCQTLSQYSSLTITISFLSDGNNNLDEEYNLSVNNNNNNNNSNSNNNNHIININSNFQRNIDSNEKLLITDIKPQHLSLNIEEIKSNQINK